MTPIRTRRPIGGPTPDMYARRSVDLLLVKNLLGLLLLLLGAVGVVAAVYHYEPWAALGLASLAIGAAGWQLATSEA